MSGIVREVTEGKKSTENNKSRPAGLQAGFC
jgi:hypothetical protein